MKLNLKERKGITLIALVITIIVLLILAGVSIAMLTGQNGILTQAQKAKTTTDNKSAEEKVKLAVMAARSQSEDASLDLEKLTTEVTTNYGGQVDGGAFPATVTIDGKSFTVDSDGNVTSKEDSNQPTPNPTDKISKSTSYVGYYADIEADGTVDGVIYADLAVGNQGSGQWSDLDGKYSIPTVTEGLKDYHISKTNYKANEGFGTKDVISPTGTGKDRFYIMALTDIDGKKNVTSYDWYNVADGKMIDYATTTSEDFGKGKSNTTTMISKWNAKAYGDQDQCSSGHKDMWGQIQEKVNNGWFVPSKTEWSAFVGELGISNDSSNEKYYENLGLSSFYWSSSQSSASNAWGADFISDYMSYSNVNLEGYVRLSATF